MTGSLATLENRIGGTELYKELRHEHPVYFDPDLHMYVVSRYDDVAAVLQQPNLFSGSRAIMSSYRFEDVVDSVLNSEGHGPFIKVLPMTDPPEHTRIRSFVNLAFSARRVAKLQDYIETLTNELIDKFIDTGKVEIVSALCRPLPVTTIGDLLCLPRERWEDVIRWTGSYTACAGNRLTSTEDGLQAGKNLAEMQNFIQALLDERRVTPGDDILTDLLNAKSEGFEPLTDKEILAISIAFVGAGHESTTVALAHLIKVMAENPAAVEELRNAPNQDAAARIFCEEVLRTQPPLNALPRMVTADTEIDGVKIPAGSFLLVLMAAANRDEKIFGPNSEEFVAARANASRHFSFGGGVHVCLGNMLARTELKIVARAVANRLDDLRLANPDIQVTDYAPAIMDWNYRLTKLDVIYSKR